MAICQSNDVLHFCFAGTRCLAMYLGALLQTVFKIIEISEILRSERTWYSSKGKLRLEDNNNTRVKVEI